MTLNRWLSLALLAATAVRAQGIEPCLDEAGRAQAIERINALRAGAAACTANAAQAVTFDARLNASAWALARDLAQRDTVSHDDAQQRPLRERLQAAGYAFVSAAENVAAGQSDVDAALASWMASPHHCENLMGAAYQQIGLACAKRDGSRYKRFWVLQLGRPAVRR